MQAHVIVPASALQELWTHITHQTTVNTNNHYTNINNDYTQEQEVIHGNLVHGSDFDLNGNTNGGAQFFHLMIWSLPE